LPDPEGKGDFEHGLLQDDARQVPDGHTQRNIIR